LKTVSDADGLIAAYNYIGPRRVKQRDYGNGTRMTYEYDGITGVPNPSGDFGVKQVTRTTHSLIATGVPFDDRVYRWDRAGNKAVHNELHTGGNARSYSYDSVDRLVRSVKTPASGPVEDIRYLLDGVGNRTQVIGGPDVGLYTMSATTPEPADRQLNQYSTTPFSTETHDRNGNLIAENSGQQGQRLLSYDHRNRMVVAVVEGTGITVRYGYDAFGRRIGKHVSGSSNEELSFVHSDWRVVEENDVLNNPVATYVHGDYIDEMLQMHRSTQKFYYQADDIYSVVSITSSEGAMVERYDYTDFGLPSRLNASLSTVGNRSFFTGREYDPEGEFTYLRTRYLDPTSGRFLSRDIVGAWTDTLNVGNPLSYAGNNPTSRLDPFGLNSAAVRVAEVFWIRHQLLNDIADQYERNLPQSLAALRARTVQSSIDAAKSKIWSQYLETGNGTVRVYYNENGNVTEVGSPSNYPLSGGYVDIVVVSEAQKQLSQLRQSLTGPLIDPTKLQQLYQEELKKRCFP